MDGVPTPTTATSQFIQAGRYKLTFDLRVVETDTGLSDDDDDIDESAIPTFSHPTMRPNTPPLRVGKSRAPEQLGLPARSAPSDQLSGNIGTPIGGATRGARQNFGGIHVESRSRTPAPFTLKREIDLGLGPAGLTLLTNRLSPPSSVTLFTPPRCMLTVG
jgi:hypothetical protein